MTKAVCAVQQAGRILTIQYPRELIADTDFHWPLEMESRSVPLRQHCAPVRYRAD